MVEISPEFLGTYLIQYYLLPTRKRIENILIIASMSGLLDGTSYMTTRDCTDRCMDCILRWPGKGSES